MQRIIELPFIHVALEFLLYVFVVAVNYLRQNKFRYKLSPSRMRKIARHGL